MSLYYDLEDPEAAQGGGAVVPNGQDIRAVIPEAVAGALPAGSTPATKKEEATGETVINDQAVNPNTGMAQAPLTGAEAAKDFTHDFTHDLLSEDQRKKGANELYDFGMGNDVKTDAVDPLTGTSRTGLPAWYQAAKLRGAKVPGSKNSHYLLDEKTWEPPSENKLGKGIAGMIANMSTAGSRVAMNEKSRPLALRMKDANRVALGEGAGMLADTLFGRKRDRYEDLLKTAKTESEIEKNRATATKGGKGSGSEASRMAALKGALDVDQGKITSDRLEHKDAVANEQSRIDADPESPKAEKLRRDIITESAGWLTENEVPHASYADLKMMRPQLGEMVRIKAQRDQARYDNEWKAFHDTHATSTKEYEKWVDDQKKMADRRRDYYLPSNMFWETACRRLSLRTMKLSRHILVRLTRCCAVLVS